MRTKLSDELKRAITLMPAVQKDKLLLRLIAKDHKLAEKLIFELLEEGKTSEKRSDALRTFIDESLSPQRASYSTPGYLLMDLRSLNARITEYAATTKDKANEVALVAYLLAEGLRRHEVMLLKYPEKRSDTLAPYLIRRVLSLLPKIKKLDEDYYADFEENLDFVFQFLWKFPPTNRIAQTLNFPKQWRPKNV